MRYAMAVDTKKCVGCSDCVIACQMENKVPLGYCREWVVEKVKGTFPNSSVMMQSERCNHCSNSPCVRCCPTGASHYASGGTVLVEKNDCIGCSACIESCPYDARFVHPEGYVDKCTFCIHKVEKGEAPACVEVCPTKCLYFGDLDDPFSEISQILRERQNQVNIPEAGTGPQVYFLS